MRSGLVTGRSFADALGMEGKMPLLCGVAGLTGLGTNGGAAAERDDAADGGSAGKEGEGTAARVESAGRLKTSAPGLELAEVSGPLAAARQSSWS